MENTGAQMPRNKNKVKIQMSSFINNLSSFKKSLLSSNEFLTAQKYEKSCSHCFNVKPYKIRNFHLNLKCRRRQIFN